MKKRILSLCMALFVIVSMLPTMAFAEAGVQDSGAAIGASGLCKHHTEHTSDCGYTEGTPEQPCNHEHTEECYVPVTNCVHIHDETCGGLINPTACTHVYGEDTSCVTKTLDCQHIHDESCGYVPAVAGTPCSFACETCKGTAVAEPEECTCTTLCAEGAVNPDCPVCSAEGTDLTACKGIQVAEGNSLTIYAQSTGEKMGFLTANAPLYGYEAGIGGGSEAIDSGGTVTLHPEEGIKIMAKAGGSAGDGGVALPKRNPGR